MSRPHERMTAARIALIRPSDSAPGAYNITMRADDLRDLCDLALPSVQPATIGVDAARGKDRTVLWTSSRRAAIEELAARGFELARRGDVLGATVCFEQMKKLIKQLQLYIIVIEHGAREAVLAIYAGSEDEARRKALDRSTGWAIKTCVLKEQPAVFRIYDSSWYEMGEER